MPARGRNCAHVCVHICVAVFVNERRLPLVVVGVLLLISGPTRNNRIKIINKQTNKQKQNKNKNKKKKKKEGGSQRFGES